MTDRGDIPGKRPADGPGGAVYGVVDGIEIAVRVVRDQWEHAAGSQARGVGPQQHCLIVAVDGPSGSGKSSLAVPLADALAAALGGDVIPLSSAGPATPEAGQGPSYLDGSGDAGAGAAERGPSSLHRDRPRIAVVSTDLLATWAHPFDWWPTLEEHLLEPLAAGLTTHLPVVTWEGGEPLPGGTLVVDGVDVLVLEGVSAGRRAIADRLAALVWVEVPDAAERLERAVARDGEAMRPYLARWQEDEARHFAADATRDRADIVIDPR